MPKRAWCRAYQKPQLKVEQLVRLNPPDDCTANAQARSTNTSAKESPRISFIWITTAAKHFVKLRLSMNPRLREELPEARRAVLGGDGRGHQTPPGAGWIRSRKTRELTGSQSWRPGGGSTTRSKRAFWYLMRLNAVADNRLNWQRCAAGSFVPSLDTELGIYRGMFKPGQELAKSRLGKTITQIDKAGFLEEYLWVDRHREAWGVMPPAGLTLPEYAEWRKKNLKRFKPPDFGTVTIDHPRPLPLEPVSP
mgnify:CR=1 FL=1